MMIFLKTSSSSVFRACLLHASSLSLFSLGRPFQGCVSFFRLLQILVKGFSSSPSSLFPFLPPSLPPYIIFPLPFPLISLLQLLTLSL